MGGGGLDLKVLLEDELDFQGDIGRCSLHHLPKRLVATSKQQKAIPQKRKLPRHLECQP